MLRAIMTEAWSIGRALGVPLADDHVEQGARARARPGRRRGHVASARPPDRPSDGARGAPGNAPAARARDGHPDALDRCGLRDPRAVGDPQRAGAAEPAEPPHVPPDWAPAASPPSRRASGPTVPPTSYGVPRRGGDVHRVVARASTALRSPRATGSPRSRPTIGRTSCRSGAASSAMTCTSRPARRARSRTGTCAANTERLRPPR